MLQTRRTFLEKAVSIPLAAELNFRRAEANGIEIISEPNCLSRESAAGFRSLTAGGHGQIRKITLLCASSTISTRDAIRLRECASAGTWIICEISPLPRNPQDFTTQRRVLRDFFGIVLCEPIHLSRDRTGNTGMYIRYGWPHTALLRTFSAVVPIVCSDVEVIAHYGSTPVAMRRRIGRGGVVLLGSMLGPNLRAEELEAQIIGREMLSALASPLSLAASDL